MRSLSWASAWLIAIGRAPTAHVPEEAGDMRIDSWPLRMGAALFAAARNSHDARSVTPHAASPMNSSISSDNVAGASGAAVPGVVPSKEAASAELEGVGAAALDDAGAVAPE